MRQYRKGILAGVLVFVMTAGMIFPVSAGNGEREGGLNTESISTGSSEETAVSGNFESEKVSDDTASEDTTSKDMVPKETTSKDTISKDTTSKETISKEIVSKVITPKNKTSELSGYLEFRTIKTVVQDTDIMISGNLPEDVTISARAIPSSDAADVLKQDAENIPYAFDISLIAPDGTEYQPVTDSNKVKVTIHPALAIDSLYTVWHIHDDGQYEAMDTEVSKPTETVFETETFSKWAIDTELHADQNPAQTEFHLSAEESSIWNNAVSIVAYTNGGSTLTDFTGYTKTGSVVTLSPYYSAHQADNIGNLFPVNRYDSGKGVKKIVAGNAAGQTVTCTVSASAFDAFPDLVPVTISGVSKLVDNSNGQVIFSGSASGETTTVHMPFEKGDYPTDASKTYTLNGGTGFDDANSFSESIPSGWVHTQTRYQGSAVCFYYRPVTYTSSYTPPTYYTFQAAADVRKQDEKGNTLTGTMTFLWRSRINSGAWSSWSDNETVSGGRSSRITCSLGRYTSASECESAVRSVTFEIRELSYSDNNYPITVPDQTFTLYLPADFTYQSHLYSQTSYINIINKKRLPPSIIKTSAVIDGSKTAYVNASSKIADTVSCANLVSGSTYYLVGTLMDQSTGEPLKIQGKTVPSVTSADFTADATSLEKIMNFPLNTSLLAGKTIVVYEQLWQKDNGTAIKKAVHEDLTDSSQSVRILIADKSGGIAKTVDHPSHDIHEDETWTIGVKIPEEWLSTTDASYRFGISDDLDPRLTYSGNFSVYIEKDVEISDYILTEPQAGTRTKIDTSDYTLSIGAAEQGGASTSIKLLFNDTGKSMIGQYILDHADVPNRYAVIIEYTTWINESAVAAEHIPNGAVLVRGQNRRADFIPENRRPYVYTGAVEAWKLDQADHTPIKGAGFTISTTASDDTALRNDADGYLVRSDDPCYAEASSCILTSDAEGRISLKGVSDGDYYLKEISTVSGHSLLADYIRIQVKDGKTVTTHSSLPVIANAQHLEILSTGGHGTLIFIVTGFMILAAAVLLFVRFKKVRRKD